MRLIDLDEIECFYLVDREGEARYKIKIGKGLPTVEAIPIEWIENYIGKMDEDDGMIYLSPSGPLRKMLKDWREEK